MSFKLKQQTGDAAFHRRQADGEPTPFGGFGRDAADARHQDAVQERPGPRAQHVGETIGSTRRGQHHAVDTLLFEKGNKFSAPGDRGRQGLVEGDGLDEATRGAEHFWNDFPGRQGTQDEDPGLAEAEKGLDRGIAENGLGQGLSDELGRNDIGPDAMGPKGFSGTPPDRGDPGTLEDPDVPALDLHFRKETGDGIFAGEDDAIEPVQPAHHCGHGGRIGRWANDDDGELDRFRAAEPDQPRGDAALPLGAGDQDALAGKGLGAGCSKPNGAGHHERSQATRRRAALVRHRERIGLIIDVHMLNIEPACNRGKSTQYHSGGFP